MAHHDVEGITVLLIDGNNLLHRTSGTADAGAQRTLIARLRGAIPPTISTVMMLDGHADTGTSRNERAGAGFEIRHSGSISADDAIVRLIDKYGRGERAGLTVVTDDRALRDRARHIGAHVERLDWLEQLMHVQLGPNAGIGAGRPPASSRGPAPVNDAEEDDRRPWSPGRGATRKHGNPRRQSSRRRDSKP